VIEFPYFNQICRGTTVILSKLLFPGNTIDSKCVCNTNQERIHDADLEDDKFHRIEDSRLGGVALRCAERGLRH
jgi:hypothetical protein